MTDGTARGPGRARLNAVVFLAAAMGWGCSPSSTQVAALRPDAAGDVPGVDHGRDRSDARIDGKPDIPATAQPTPPGNIQFPDPPLIACSRESDCDFPPPACADPSCDAGICPGYAWIVYYDNPRCTGGSCAFEQRYFQCMESRSCSGGGCLFNGTASP